MEFLKIFLRSISLIPSLVQSVESLYGAKTGAQKREAAIAIAGAAINVGDAAEGKQIVNAAAFTKGLGTIVDGVGACLNASIWAKS